MTWYPTQSYYWDNRSFPCANNAKHPVRKKPVSIYKPLVWLKNHRRWTLNLFDHPVWSLVLWARASGAEWRLIGWLVNWLVNYYIRATFKVMWMRLPTCASADWLQRAAPLENRGTCIMTQLPHLVTWFRYSATHSLSSVSTCASASASAPVRSRSDSMTRLIVV